MLALERVIATVQQAAGPVCDACLPMVAVVGHEEADSYRQTLLEQGRLKRISSSCSICGAVGSANLPATRLEQAALPETAAQAAELPPSKAGACDSIAGTLAELSARLNRIENQLVNLTAWSRAPQPQHPPVYLGDGMAMCWLSPGLKFFVDSSDWTMTPHLLYNGMIEPEVTKLFSSLIHPGDTVLDIGANYGYYTMLGARAVGRHGRVYAIEASPANFFFLQRNVAVNDFKDFVQIFQNAALNERKSVELAFQKGSAGGPTLVANRNDPNRQWVTVEAVPIDELIPDAQVDVIKIDVEGSEPLVFEGMTKLLERSRNVKIIMEFAPIFIRATVDPARFLQRIHELGFDIRLINDKSGVEPFDEAQLCQSPGLHMLYLARPEGKV